MQIEYTGRQVTVTRALRTQAKTGIRPDCENPRQNDQRTRHSQRNQIQADRGSDHKTRLSKIVGSGRVPEHGNVST